MCVCVFKQDSAGYLQCAVNPVIDKADQTFSPSEATALLYLQISLQGLGTCVCRGTVSMPPDHH